MICHRDMKSDNVLLDFDTDDEVPHLVLSDFGSALATGSWSVRYHSDTIDLGGNVALRAPEIRRAVPGPNTVLNFEMADTWAAGTLAHEIFTGRNPFYQVLNSAAYRPTDVPPLPLVVSAPIARTVAQMLAVDPRARPSPAVAANVLAFSLLRFGADVRTFVRQCGIAISAGFERACATLISKTVEMINENAEQKLHELAKLYATETIVMRLIGRSEEISKVELQLRATFLARIDREELRSALLYFADTTQQTTPI